MIKALCDDCVKNVMELWWNCDGFVKKMRNRIQSARNLQKIVYNLYFNHDFIYVLCDEYVKNVMILWRLCDEHVKIMRKITRKFWLP